MPTIEELQNQILELQSKYEELSTENTATKEQLESAEKDLKQAREINGKLWLNTKAGMKEESPSEPEEPELTVAEQTNKLIDECMAPELKHMKQIYGDNINITPTE